jgi:hypothetical protein
VSHRRSDMTVRGPHTDRPSRRRRRTQVWSPRGLVALILAIIVVALVIALALSR